MVALSLGELWIEERVSWAPRRNPMLPIEWARQITLPGGTRRGQRYVPESHPGQYYFLSAYTSNEWTEFVVIGPTQDGKTVCAILVPTIHRLIECGESVVYGLPDELAGQRQWREKVQPIFTLSGMSDCLPENGIGSKGGSRVTVMSFPTGGLLTWMGAGGKNESAQSSVTAPLVVVDEVDSMKSGMPEKIARRADAYGMHARRIYTSTIKHDDGSSKILQMLLQSTNARIWCACPHCGRFQSLEWERVTYDPADDLTAFESARLRCAHCAVLWTEADRKAALRNHQLVMEGQSVDDNGHIIGERPRSMVWGIRWTALDSPLEGRSLGQLCVWNRRADEARKSGDHQPLRQFYRDQLCKVYVEDHLDEEGKPPERVTKTYLADRSSRSNYGPAVLTKTEIMSFHVADAPEDVRWFVAAVDVQDNRCYHLLQGRDDEGRSWDIAWGYVMACRDGPASEAQLHVAFDATTIHLEKVATEEGHAIAMRGIDTGHREAEIRNWLARNRPWIAVRGVGEAKSDEMYAKGERMAEGAYDLAEVLHVRRNPKNGWQTFWIVSNNVRRFAQNAFLAPIGSAGAAHLPRGLHGHDHYIRHLCSHNWILNRNTMKWEWSKKIEYGGQARDDWLACRTYCEGLARWNQSRNLRRTTSKRRFGVVGAL